MSAEVVDVLKRARERLAKPGAWTKGEFARDAVGEGVTSCDPHAVCWCALGAVNVEAEGIALPKEREAAKDALAVAAGLAKGDTTGVVKMNDSQETVEPVLELFDKAIARLESEVAS